MADYGAEDDPLTYAIIGCAIRVHKELGPGLLESAYEDGLAREFVQAGLSFRKQPSLRMSYAGELLDRTYRPDFIVENEVVVEVKSIATFLPVHEAQVLTYMRLSAKERGLLLNFNVALLKDGIRRLILTRAPRGAPVVE
jgi:GxxExxY protein